MNPVPPGPDVRICSTQKTLRVPRKAITALAAFVARRQGVRLDEADVAVVGAGEMAWLNERYARHAGCTDVLSFDLTGPGAGGLAAQIIVCADMAAAEAEKRNTSPRRELLLYVVHGLLHLMGHDDTTAGAAAAMHAREGELLDAFSRHAGARRRSGAG